MMNSISKDSEKCIKCPKYDSCDKKRKELCAYIVPKPLAEKAKADCTMPIMNDMIVKRDYRTIRYIGDVTGKEQSFDIDSEQIKKELGNQIYNSLQCNFLKGGA